MEEEVERNEGIPKRYLNSCDDNNMVINSLYSFLQSLMDADEYNIQSYKNSYKEEYSIIDE